MLDLTKLRYLVTLARRANYARAAEELGISQPALTRTIQTLEAQLGLRLFDRDRSGVRVTPQGRDFADRAAVLVANAEDLERHATLTVTAQSGRVRFGMAPMPARALLASVLQARLVEAPQLVNDIVVRNVGALWPLLTSGEIEFFVSAEGQVPDAPPVRALALGTFPVSYLVRKGHPLLNGLEPPQSYPLLLSTGREVALPPELKSYVVTPPHVVEDFGALVALTSSTDAIWVSSTYAVSAELADETLVELPIAKPPGHEEYRMMMYSLDRRTQSPAARVLKDAMIRRIKVLKEGL
jgi:DNA-binding transcriptional LysR family regulator